MVWFLSRWSLTFCFTTTTGNINISYLQFILHCSYLLRAGYMVDQYLKTTWTSNYNRQRLSEVDAHGPHRSYSWDGDLIVANSLKTRKRQYELNFEAHILFPLFLTNQYRPSHHLGREDKKEHELLLFECNVCCHRNFKPFTSTSLWWTIYQCGLR